MCYPDGVLASCALLLLTPAAGEDNFNNNSTNGIV